MKPRGQAATSGRGRRGPDLGEAQATAIAALSFLATDSERICRFLALAGLTPQSLRAAAAEPAFLGAVIDHVVSDPGLLFSFAASIGRDPSEIARARALLVGPEPWSSP
jgi:hypothetical protein